MIYIGTALHYIVIKFQPDSVCNLVENILMADDIDDNVSKRRSVDCTRCLVWSDDHVSTGRTGLAVVDSSVADGHCVDYL